MAITSLITIKETAAALPASYSPPVISDISGEDAIFETDIAITAADAADPATGIANVLAAVKTFFDSTYAVNTMKLNTTAAIVARIYILKVARVNTANSIFLTGTEVFRCKVAVVYN